MKPTESQLQFIKTSFQQIQTVEDLVALLNLSRSIQDKNGQALFSPSDFYHCASARLKTKHYHQFKIQKKSGGERTILAPVKKMETIQKALAFLFQQIYLPNPAAHGFVKNKSIVSNAQLHTSKHYVYNVDLKDFFFSIESHQVLTCLYQPPFNLSSTANRKNLARLIASIVTIKLKVERKDHHGVSQMVERQVLPQGAPTSPILSNLVGERLDQSLSGLATRLGLAYSRYADDITFSSMHNVYASNGLFINELQRIVIKHHFELKDSKTRLRKEGYRMEVTGLLVNHKVNVHKKYIKFLRACLHRWESGSPAIISPQVFAGKLNYLRMVKGNDNPMCKKMTMRFKQCVA